MLAEILNLAPDYLSNLFATQMGMTLTAYINRMREDYACRLLADSMLSVKGIAWRPDMPTKGILSECSGNLPTTPRRMRKMSISPFLSTSG